MKLLRKKRGFFLNHDWETFTPPSPFFLFLFSFGFTNTFSKSRKSPLKLLLETKSYKAQQNLIKDFSFTNHIHCSLFFSSLLVPSFGCCSKERKKLSLPYSPKRTPFSKPHLVQSTPQPPPQKKPLFQANKTLQSHSIHRDYPFPPLVRKKTSSTHMYVYINPSLDETKELLQKKEIHLVFFVVVVI